jgi:hypothetical protein
VLEAVADPYDVRVGVGSGALDEEEGVEGWFDRLVEQDEAPVGEVLLAQGAGQHAVAGARGHRRDDGVQVGHGDRGPGRELSAEDVAPVAAHDGQILGVGDQGYVPDRGAGVLGRRVLLDVARPARR